MLMRDREYECGYIFATRNDSSLLTHLYSGPPKYLGSSDPAVKLYIL